MYSKFYFLNFVHVKISSFNTNSAEIKLLIVLGCITMNTIFKKFLLYDRSLLLKLYLHKKQYS